jgi:hypothetical protein
LKSHCWTSINRIPLFNWSPGSFCNHRMDPSALDTKMVQMQRWSAQTWRPAAGKPWDDHTGDPGRAPMDL